MPARTTTKTTRKRRAIDHLWTWLQEQRGTGVWVRVTDEDFQGCVPLARLRAVTDMYRRIPSARVRYDTATRRMTFRHDKGRLDLYLDTPSSVSAAVVALPAEWHRLAGQEWHAPPVDTDAAAVEDGA